MNTVIVIVLFALPLAVQSAKKTESFWDKVLRIAGVSATPSSLRGEEKPASGDIWVTAAAPDSVAQRLTREGGYTSPVFDFKQPSILALKGGDLYRVPLQGEAPAKVRSLTGVIKLVGVSRDDADQLLVLTKEPIGGSSAALLSIHTGALTAIAHDPQSKEDEMMLAHLAGWERVFGDVRLYCEDNEQEGAGGSTIRFTDVYLKRGNEAPINLTNGKGVSSCQPSLSPDGKRVVFIRAVR
jgi:hypothetical protein